MSTANIKFPRNLLTASAASILLASTAFAQGPGIETRPTVDTQQVPANPQLPDRNLTSARSGADFSTGDGGVSTSEQAVAPDTQELTEHEKEQLVINRSFDDEEALAEAGEIEAGSTAQITPQSDAPLGEPLANENENKLMPPSIRNVPEGTGVIAVDGKVIAKTTGEQANNEPQEQQSTNQQGAQNQASDRSNTITSNESQLSTNGGRQELSDPTAADLAGANAAASSQQTEQAATAGDTSAEQPAQAQRNQQAITNPQPTGESATGASLHGSELSNFENLKDTTVINSAGKEIGYIEAVALHPESGAVGLIIATRGLLGIRAQEVLAPVEEVTISGDSVVWNTNKSKSELRRSERFNEDDYDRISANTKSRAGISQR